MQIVEVNGRVSKHLCAFGLRNEDSVGQIHRKTAMLLGPGSTPGDKINNQDDQRNQYQQVDQVPGNVQYKTQKPQDQKYSNNRTKHALPPN
jgi:hypothetical protein